MTVTFSNAVTSPGACAQAAGGSTAPSRSAAAGMARLRSFIACGPWRVDGMWIVCSEKFSIEILQRYLAMR
jgi:hypothetical protein